MHFIVTEIANLLLRSSHRFKIINLIDMPTHRNSIVLKLVYMQNYQFCRYKYMHAHLQKPYMK